MSYQVLARKYRPQLFRNVVGQPHVTRTLQNAITAQRLHHAYLLSGVRGVGKTTIARLLAKALNCVSFKEGEPCNQCENCQDISSGRSLNVQEIDGASNTSVDDVREIRENVKYIPASGVYKIYIIDEVHMLSTSAFNALLKTLEEPPPHVIFIFATTEPGKLPQTILSRCQRYDLRRVGQAAIMELLKELAEKEGVTISEDALAVIAREADGSIRDAESLFDQTIAFSGNSITYDHLKSLLGFSDHGELDHLIHSLIQRETSEILAVVERGYQNGENLIRFANDLLEHLHQLYVIISGGDPAKLMLPPSGVTTLVRLSKLTTRDYVEQWYRILYRVIDDLHRSRFPKVVLESVLLQMAQARPIQSVDQLLHRIEKLSSSISEPTVKISSTVSVPPKSVMPEKDSSLSAFTPDHGAKDWDGFLAWLAQKKPQVVTILSHGELQEITESGVMLFYPTESIYREMMLEQDRCRNIEDLMKEFFGRSISIQIGTSPDSSTKLPNSKGEISSPKPNRKELVEEAVKNQTIQKTMTLFNASIDDVKER